MPAQCCLCRGSLRRNKQMQEHKQNTYRSPIPAPPFICSTRALAFFLLVHLLIYHWRVSCHPPTPLSTTSDLTFLLCDFDDEKTKKKVSTTPTKDPSGNKAIHPFWTHTPANTHTPPPPLSFHFPFLPAPPPLRRVVGESTRACKNYKKKAPSHRGVQYCLSDPPLCFSLLSSRYTPILLTICQPLFFFVARRTGFCPWPGM